MYEPEIVPKPYAEWSKDHMNEVGISKMKITYTQEQDNESPIPRDQEDQYLTVEAVGADMADREGIIKHQNYYYVISTERWALNSHEELAIILKDFEDRLYHCTNMINDHNKDGNEERRNVVSK